MGKFPYSPIYGHTDIYGHFFVLSVDCPGEKELSLQSRNE